MTIKQATSWLSQPGIVAMIHDPTTRQALRVAVKALEQLPSAQPKRETTTLKIGRTRNSVTMWYECAECGEPVDHEDAFCRRCGRGIIHE